MFKCRVIIFCLDGRNITKLEGQILKKYFIWIAVSSHSARMTHNTYSLPAQIVHGAARAVNILIRANNTYWGDRRTM